MRDDGREDVHVELGLMLEDGCVVDLGCGETDTEFLQLRKLGHGKVGRAECTRLGGGEGTEDTW